MDVSTLETVFQVMFGVGLLLTVVTAFLSGAFHHEFGSGSALGSGVAHDLGGPHIETGHDVPVHAGRPEVGWSTGEMPGFSPWSPTVICSVLAGAGGVGLIALDVWRVSIAGSILLAIAGGLVLGGATFGLMAWIFRRVQASSHVVTLDLIGRRARVETAVEPGTAGAIGFEAAGSRMVVPARGVEPASIPTGAEVEIVRVDGAVYFVRETRDSWLARSKQQAGR